MKPFKHQPPQKDAALNQTPHKVWTRDAPEIEEDLDAPSKTQRKADMDALQELGVTLTELPKSRLAVLDLPESLLDAINEFKRLTANGALRRQRQYIGSLMRQVDTAPIIEQIAIWDGKNQAENARFHQLENWRDRLVADAKALDAFIGLYPGAEIQTLRNLIRNAQKELAANKPPKSSRELFKLLREISEANVANDETTDDSDDDSAEDEA